MKSPAVKKVKEFTQALERLQLASQIRELAGLRKPVKLRGRPRLQAFAARALRVAESRGLKSLTSDPRRQRRLYAGLIIVLRFLARGWRGLGPASTPRAISGALRRHSLNAQGVSGYVTSAESEQPVIRTSLLLRLLKRHGASIDLLIRRLRSGLPSGQTRHWLSFFLQEMGEVRGEAALAPTNGSATPEPEAGPARPPAGTRLRYGAVILTMFDSEVFRASLRSLLRSDFEGPVVVVEDGPEQGASCRAFCDSVGVEYVKNPVWSGSGAAMNLGIERLGPQVDLVVFAHNDVLWPGRWFGQLDRAWDLTYDGGKVGLLNLGYLQFRRRLDAALTELFLRGQYDDVVWILRSLREIPELMVEVQDAQVRSGERLFGLSRDPWNDWVPEVRLMTGRFSVAVSFPTSIWREMGGFDPALPYGFDLELQHYCLTRRRWIFFINNPPVVHLASSDTKSLTPAIRAGFDEKVRQTYRAFEKKYGWHIDHFLGVYFTETTVVFQDEIVRAANQLRFEDIDFVFDEFQARLSGRKLSNCELTWCRSRVHCKYA